MSRNTHQYFRSRFYDLTLIIFTPAIAVLSAYIVYKSPQYFELVLTLDLLLLGYHHVISTYTRIASSKVSIKEYRFLVFVLPILVLLGVVLCALIGSVWLIATIYLHWQWWHYTRQSEGIAKSIKFKTKSVESGQHNFNRVAFYGIPIVSFLFMSSKEHATFLFMPIKTIPVPSFIAGLLLTVATCLLLYWLLLQVRALKKKKLTVQHFTYLVSHHLIYLVAYVFIDDITIGWLAINIWHNAQYILFVWNFNNNKFRNDVSKNHLIISWLSQSSITRVSLYFGVCLIATFGFYSLVDAGVGLFSVYTDLPLLVIAYQAINFHHYVVDSVIWKIRKASVRKSLGINE